MENKYRKECEKLKKIKNKDEKHRKIIFFLKKISQEFLKPIDKKEYNEIFYNLKDYLLFDRIEYKNGERWIDLIDEKNIKYINKKKENIKKVKNESFFNIFTMDNTYKAIAFILKDHFELKNKFAMLLLFLMMISILDLCGLQLMKAIHSDYYVNDMFDLMEKSNSFSLSIITLHSESLNVISFLLGEYKNYIQNNKASSHYLVSTVMSIFTFLIIFTPICFDYFKKLDKKQKIHTLCILLPLLIWTLSYMPSRLFYIQSLILMLSVVMITVFIRETIILICLLSSYEIFNYLMTDSLSYTILMQHLSTFSECLLKIILMYMGFYLIRLLFLRCKNKYDASLLYKYLFYCLTGLFLSFVLKSSEIPLLILIFLVLILYYMALNIKYAKFIFSIKEFFETWRQFFASIIASYTAYIFLSDKGVYFLTFLIKQFDLLRVISE